MRGRGGGRGSGAASLSGLVSVGNLSALRHFPSLPDFDADPSMCRRVGDAEFLTELRIYLAYDLA